MKKYICKIVGHNIIRKPSNDSLVKEYVCTNCRKEFTKDGYGKLVALDSFWKLNNERLRKAQAING